MWQLITGYEPEVPFMPRPYSIRVIDQDVSGWTYGHQLLEQRREWDPDNILPVGLLCTVAQCMDYIPLRRPDVFRLRAIIDFYWQEDLDAGDGSDIPAMRNWSETLFAGMPPLYELLGGDMLHDIDR